MRRHIEQIDICMVDDGRLQNKTEAIVIEFQWLKFMHSKIFRYMHMYQCIQNSNSDFSVGPSNSELDKFDWHCIHVKHFFYVKIVLISEYTRAHLRAHITWYVLRSIHAWTCLARSPAIDSTQTIDYILLINGHTAMLC